MPQQRLAKRGLHTEQRYWEACSREAGRQAAPRRAQALGPVPGPDHCTIPLPPPPTTGREGEALWHVLDQPAPHATQRQHDEDPALHKDGGHDLLVRQGPLAVQPNHLVRHVRVDACGARGGPRKDAKGTSTLSTLCVWAACLCERCVLRLLCVVCAVCLGGCAEGADEEAA